MSTVVRHGDANAYVIQAEAGQLLESLRTQLLATGGMTDGTMCVLVCTNPGPGGVCLKILHGRGIGRGGADRSRLSRGGRW